MAPGTLDWLSKNWSSITSNLISLAALSVAWAAYRRKARPELHFTMWAEIMPQTHQPREVLWYRFRNDGTGAVHVESISGDRGFTLDKYFDPFTIGPDPEPIVGHEVPASFVQFLEKRPTRIFARDSTGKKWSLSKKDLRAMYELLEPKGGSSRR
jgi:hypothetical protein